jgi:hypothetical protein
MNFRTLLFFILVLSTWSCISTSEQKTDDKAPDCDVYIRNMQKLERQLLETEQNAARLEEVIYQLTQNYLVIDQKIRLIQKFKADPSQGALLKRTASEINVFFSNSHQLLDSTETQIRRSKLPQSSMIPILETVRDYLSHQEKLFIEVYGSIGSIQNQVAKLKEVVAQKEKEIHQKDQHSEAALLQKEKESRKIFYLVGSKAELQRARAVQKKGGFLGVGGNLKLSDKLDEMYFQGGDYAIIKEISLGNTQKVNLITTHPSGSYLLLDTPGERYLKITNPEKFWSTSKFLVVEVD